MALKPGGKTFVIAEQIIRDVVTGLTIQVRGESKGRWQLFIKQDKTVSFDGNRVFDFSKAGANDGTGLYADEDCPAASWLAEVKADTCKK